MRTAATGRPRTPPPRILVLGPGRHCRGGICSVINAHARLPTWHEYRCLRIETADDRSLLRKVAAFLGAFIAFVRHAGSGELVHIHSASYRSFYRKAVFILLARVFRLKTVVHVHGGAFIDFANHRRCVTAWLARTILNRADAVVALAPSLSAQLSRITPRPGPFHVPNPCPVPKARPSRCSGDTILFAGWLEPAKGLLELVHALAQVRRAIPRATLRIAGKGDSSPTIHLAERLGVSDAVFLLGWLGPDALLQEFASADVFCLPSRCEGVPMSILEAMAQGLPVVTCPVGGIPDVIQSGRNGVLVPPGDVTGLATALRQLLDDPLGRAILGEQARRDVGAACGADRIAGELRRLYDQLLTR